MNKKKNKKKRIYHFYIVLLDIEPKIWRRFSIQADKSLYDLHYAIQVVMSWEFMHLAEFKIHNYTYTDPSYTSEKTDKDYHKYKINTFIQTVNQSFRYNYNHIEGWEHELILEKITEETDHDYEICLEGERACPPENCGGLIGYKQILEIIASQEGKEYQDLIKWLGPNYNPELFDPELVNDVFNSEQYVNKYFDMDKDDLFEIIEERILEDNQEDGVLRSLKSLFAYNNSITEEDDLDIYEDYEEDDDQFLIAPKKDKAKNVDFNQDLYHLTISLQDVKPLIWRKISVNSNILLPELHDVIQIVMGWDDDHLHEFRANRINYIDKKINSPLSKSDKDYRKVRLSDILSKKSKAITYEYDFGDGWEHKIVLSQIIPKSGQAYSVCLEGARSCPPEDSGGPHGYQMKLDILKDKKNKNYEDILDWMGEDYDPEKFDIDLVNKRLKRYYRIK